MGLPEFRRDKDLYKGQKFEIQVRTLLQHAWATLSHKLTYKADAEAPRALRRKIAMLSALLETADDASVELQGFRQRIQKEYLNKIESNNLNGILIDVESVSAYLQKSEIVREWWEIAEKIGWKPLPPIQINSQNKSKNEIDFEKEKREKEREKLQTAGLVALLSLGKIIKLSYFDDMLKRNKKICETYLHQLYDKLSESGEHLNASVHDVLRAIVLHENSKTIKKEDLRSLEYAETLIEIYSSLCQLE